LENLIYALPLRIPHSTQSIPRHSTRNHPRKIRHNKPHGATTQPSYHTPKETRRFASILRHTLLPQHLLKHIAKLLILEFFFFLLILRFETEARPWEAARSRSARVWYVFIGVKGCGCCGGTAAETVVGSCGVVVTSTGGVGEGVVGVIYMLEFTGSFGAFWGIGGDAVRVGSECLSREALAAAFGGAEGRIR